MREVAVMWMEISTIASIAIRQPVKKSSITGSRDTNNGAKPVEQDHEKPNVNLERIRVELTSSKTDDDQKDEIEEIRVEEKETV